MCGSFSLTPKLQGKLHLWLQVSGNRLDFRDAGWQDITVPEALNTEQGPASQEAMERDVRRGSMCPLPLLCPRTEHESLSGKKWGEGRENNYLLILRLKYSLVQLLGHLRWVPAARIDGETLATLASWAAATSGKTGRARFLGADSEKPAARCVFQVPLRAAVPAEPGPTCFRRWRWAVSKERGPHSGGRREVE